MKLLPPVERWPSWLVRLAAWLMIPVAAPLFVGFAFRLAFVEGWGAFREELGDRLTEVCEIIVELWDVAVGSWNAP